MIAAWMLYSLVVGALIAAAALAGDHVSRILRLPVRVVWVAGMAGTVALSGIALVHLSKTAGVAAVAEVDAVTSVASAAAGSESVDGWRHTLDEVAAFLDRATTITADRAYGMAAQQGGSNRLLAGAWLALSVVLLAVFGGTLLRFRSLRRRWRAHSIDGIAVLVSDDTGPALVGMMRPAIVVPDWLLAEPVNSQRLVVLHEEEHRRAGDHVLLGAACLIVCVMPWNAALWWMLLRLRLAVELDCDARVLRRGAGPRSYGSMLLEIAAHARAYPFGAPALTDSPTHLERRLINMTERTNSPRRLRAAGTGLMALLLGTAACATELPTAAAIDDMSAAEAREQATRAGLLVASTDDDAAVPLYVVDGVIVSARTANELTPEEIARVEVVKGAAAVAAYGERATSGVIHIGTRVALMRDGAEAAVPLGTPLVEGQPVAGSAAERRALVRRAAESDVAQGGVPIVVRGADDGVGTVVRARGLTLEASAFTDESPLTVIDGVIVTDAAGMRVLNPDAIVSIEVLKGAAARSLYDHPRAANGVIRISTGAGVR
jgi:beta-lactamase regulating signal transducer with metallopeptidase domain